VTRRVLGADGCPAGWVVVALHDGAVADVEVVEDLREVLVDEPAAVAVDMPIGLIDADRDADRHARLLLPGRASSVFSTPPLAVVEAWRSGAVTTHAEATALAVATTGKGISQQAWRLVPKIAAVDDEVAQGLDALEVHPEVAFAVVAGDALPRKRSWAGITTRRAILARLGIELPDRFPGDEDAAPDDVVDAAICAWVADGAASGEALLTIPDTPTQHHRGRPIAITARPAPPVVPGPRGMPRA
jgi:predicted RNase H-like nuclease